MSEHELFIVFNRLWFKQLVKQRIHMIGKRSTHPSSLPHGVSPSPGFFRAVRKGRQETKFENQILEGVQMLTDDAGSLADIPKFTLESKEFQSVSITVE